MKAPLLNSGIFFVSLKLQNQLDTIDSTRLYLLVPHTWSKYYLQQTQKCYIVKSDQIHQKKSCYILTSMSKICTKYRKLWKSYFSFQLGILSHFCQYKRLLQFCWRILLWGWIIHFFMTKSQNEYKIRVAAHCSFCFRKRIDIKVRKWPILALKCTFMDQNRLNIYNQL